MLISPGLSAATSRPSAFSRRFVTFVTVKPPRGAVVPADAMLRQALSMTDQNHSRTYLGLPARTSPLMDRLSPPNPTTQKSRS